MSYHLIGQSKEARLEQRALQEGWHIPDDVKRVIVARQVTIAVEAEKNRDATRAALALLQIDKHQQSQQSSQGYPINIYGPNFADALSQVIRARMALEENTGSAVNGSHGIPASLPFKSTG